VREKPQGQNHPEASFIHKKIYVYNIFPVHFNYDESTTKEKD